MPKPKIYYIKGKKYKGIELTLEEQQALCRKNLNLIRGQIMRNTAEIKQRMLEGVKCKCGKPSVEFDSWFNWFPCEEHRALNPVQYSEWEPTNVKRPN